jgi:DNA (cytosine-5)-methyltransferase 1
MKTIAEPEKSIEVLLAAPPCQGFSSANTNIFDMTESNMLAMTIPEAVQILRPKVLVFENVRGFMNQSKSKDICQLFLDNLSNAG